MTVKIAVSGASGRMGSAILGLAAKDKQFEIVGALDMSSSPSQGKSLASSWPSLGIKNQATLHSNLKSFPNKPQVLIDFTQPPATLQYLKEALALGVGMVIGTTGFSELEKKTIQSASKKIPIVLSPNMAIGMNLLFLLAEETAKRLGMEYDVEIAEAHHNLKKDAPSGTALGLGEAVARAWNVDLNQVSTHGRQGKTGERVKGTIGFHAIRGGDIVGDHTVLFAGTGERLELTHRAHNRTGLAQGALKAAMFLGKKKNGFFNMGDVLGLHSKH